jgi:hypothetical protein
LRGPIYGLADGWVICEVLAEDILSMIAATPPPDGEPDKKAMAIWGLMPFLDEDYEKYCITDDYRNAIKAAKDAVGA